MSVTIEFPWAKPPLSMNDRPRHWAARNDDVQAVRQAAKLACKSKLNRGDLTPGEPVEVTLIWYVTTNHRRDIDNPVATLKPICDGLVDAGLVPDDTPEWIYKRPVRIIRRKGAPGVELRIETRDEVVRRAGEAIRVASGDGRRLGIAWCENMARIALDAAEQVEL